VPLVIWGPIAATILAALIAAVAALWGARVTTRRERWIFKRDLYARLLEHLHEASVLLDAMVRTGKVDKLPDLNTAIEEARRARAVAALFLHPETRRALDELDTTWRRLRDQGDSVAALKERVAAIRAAYDAVVAAGQKDLRP
jgi:hypothetical protein